MKSKTIGGLRALNLIEAAMERGDLERATVHRESCAHPGFRLRCGVTYECNSYDVLLMLLDMEDRAKGQIPGADASLSDYEPDSLVMPDARITTAVRRIVAAIATAIPIDDDMRIECTEKFTNIITSERDR